MIRNKLWLLAHTLTATFYSICPHKHPDTYLHATVCRQANLKKNSLLSLCVTHAEKLTRAVSTELDDSPSLI